MRIAGGGGVVSPLRTKSPSLLGANMFDRHVMWHVVED